MSIHWPSLSTSSILFPSSSLFLLLFVENALLLHAIGSTSRVQCPEGHYLSRFASAFDGSERFYKFGCSKFGGAWTATMLEEKCESTEMASMEGGADVYLSCGSDQYTAGVQIVEGTAPMGSTNGQQTVELWQFLCCRSESIHIRLGDCIETKFINDFRRSSSFSSSAQVIRRWQAMSENGDRRWWLQICPVDVHLELKKHAAIGRNEVRARREVPWEWANSRFPANPTIHPYYHRRRMIAQAEGKNLNSYAVVGAKRGRTLMNVPPTTTSTSTAQTTPQTSTTMLFSTDGISVAEKEEEESDSSPPPPLVDLPKLMSTARTSAPLHKSRLLQFNERIRARMEVGKSNNERPSSTIRHEPARQQKQAIASSSTTELPLEALDYYDIYDDTFDKAKHLGSGGLLGGVTDFIQSLQDGLTLAQAAFPAANVKLNERNGPGEAKGFHLKIAVTPPTDQAEFAFSRDEEEVGGGEEEAERNNLQIGSFVQQTAERKMGPKPKRPTTTELRREANTIESMLQMIGLCQGHPEL